MRTLAIDTATEACSVALFDSQDLLAREHVVLGRGHAEHLIPMVSGLPDKGRAHRIIVSLGPGSFTGLRIGIAAARALGIAWGAKVLGYPTLALVARQAWQPDASGVTVCMNGGHGEWFVQNFAADGAVDEVRSLSPEQARLTCKFDLVAGNRANELAALFEPAKQSLEILPDASQALLLPDDQLTTTLAPIYGRAADAVPQKGSPPVTEASS